MSCEASYAPVHFARGADIARSASPAPTLRTRERHMNIRSRNFFGGSAFSGSMQEQEVTR